MGVNFIMIRKRKLVTALACRNSGTRLYGKPLQNLDIDNEVSILEYIINWNRTISVVDKIVLGISEGVDNLTFIEAAKKRNIPYIIGDEEDVLSRLIQCGEEAGASDILRLTTESPFICFEPIENAWRDHVNGNYDITCLYDVPDGSGFEIIKLDALKYSHDHGERRHRSELCSLYIRENKDKFKIHYVDVPQVVRRPDLRLTVDYPEDLVLCRAIYAHFKEKAPKIPLAEIINFLDQNQVLELSVSHLIALKKG